MDKFVVSARKYRPQTFDTVVGQQHITTTLKNAIKNNQLAHAYLFCGPRGVGKTTCARIFAKTINCENPTPEGEACNECASCKSFNEGISLNISELDAASNNSVEDIRSLVEQVRFAPQAGKYKVYIIDEVHMLSTAAFNAFLKTLEEPPSYVVFILATTEKHKLLPTILSRCQIFDFKRITSQDTVGHLEDIAQKEHVEAEKSALQVIAQKSEGCMRDALSLMDKIVSFTAGKLTYKNTLENLNILDDDYYFRMLEALHNQDLPATLLLYDEINKKGFEGDIVINGLEDFFRNLLVCKNEKAAVLLDVVDGVSDKYRKAAQTEDTSFLLSALNVLNEAEVNYKTARNKRLHVEMALIKLTYLQQALALSADENGTVTKKKLIDGPRAYRIKPIAGVAINGAPAKAGIAPKNNSDGKIYIEEGAQPRQPVTATPEKTGSKMPETKPVMAAPPSEKPQLAPQPVLPVTKDTKLPVGNHKKKNLLNELINRYGNEYDITEIADPEDLEPQRLQEIWNSFADKLLKQEKHSAASAFHSATLTVESPVVFRVTVQALMQQKFIEQEKALLSDFIQQAFHNRNVNFHITVEKTKEDEQPSVKSMNSREKYELLATKYPLIKVLKDNLRLEIDY